MIGVVWNLVIFQDPLSGLNEGSWLWISGNASAVYSVSDSAGMLLRLTVSEREIMVTE